MRTILVVDDDPWVRGLTRDVLIAEGYRVLEAADGPDAIRVADRPGPIHLLLTDVVMPGMNGCELAARLAGARADLRIMFMSAYDRDFLVARGIGPVAGPVITKPFTVEYLARRVQMALTDRAPACAPSSSSRAG